MQSARVVNFVDEAWKRFGGIVEGFNGRWVDGLDLQDFHEAFRGASQKSEIQTTTKWLFDICIRHS